jgi:hypothetical protein
VETIGYHPTLRDFEDVFGEIPGLPPNRDIDFSIDLVPGDALVSVVPDIDSKAQRIMAGIKGFK